MARYLLQTGVDRFKGSPGGATFQKCGKVFAIRKRNVPVQKRSASQSRVKNAFDTKAKRWKTIGATARATWTTFASQYPRVDSLGNTYIVKGIALQISSNLLRISVSQGNISSLVAAIIPSAFTESLFSFDRAATSFELRLNPVNIQANTRFAFYAGVPGATQRSFALKDCKLMGHLNAGQSTLVKDWYTEYVALFPNYPTSGNFWIPIFIQVIQATSGQVIGTFMSWSILEN
jgi:hypothetical protein